MRTAQDYMFDHQLTIPTGYTEEIFTRALMLEPCLSMMQLEHGQWACVMENAEGELHAIMHDDDRQVPTFHMGINAYRMSKSSAQVFADMLEGEWARRESEEEAQIINNNPGLEPLTLSSVESLDRSMPIDDYEGLHKHIKVYTSAYVTGNWEFMSSEDRVKCYLDWPWRPNEINGSFVSLFTATIGPQLTAELSFPCMKASLDMDSVIKFRKVSEEQLRDSVRSQAGVDRLLLELSTPEGLIYITSLIEDSFKVFTYTLEFLNNYMADELPSELETTLINLDRSWAAPGMIAYGDTALLDDALDYITLNKIGK